MPKLRETDKRPKRQFQPGDVVRKKDGMVGLVLQTEADSRAYGYQLCWCIFAPREMNLYSAARAFVARRSKDPEYVTGVKISNTQLAYLRTAPESWLKRVSAQEIRTLRFVQIVEED